MAVKFSALLLVGLLAASQVFAQSGQNGGSSGPSGAGGGGGGGTGANPTATAGPTAVNGSATTFLRSDGAPAVQLGTAAQKGIVQADGTTISVSAGIISSVNNGTVTSLATACGLSGGPITSTGTISSNSNPNVQTGANYAFQSTDCGSIVYLNNASNQIPTIAQAGSAGFLKGYYVEACNIGVGTQTITPATSTIGGASALVLPSGSAASPKCANINSDGTNYVLDLTSIGASSVRSPYVANNWYFPDYTQLNTGGGATVGASTVKLTPVQIKQSCHVGAIAVDIKTLSAGDNVQFALYASDVVTGLPTGSPLATTGNVSTAATGRVSGTFSSSASVTPGFYWIAVQASSAVPLLQVFLPGGPSLFASEVGTSSLATLWNGSGFVATGVSTPGTFNSWASLTSATFTPANQTVIFSYQVTSVP